MFALTSGARLARRLALALAGLCGLWLITLLVLGWLYGDRYGQGVADRMAESLKASGAVRDSDLALVRGQLELAELHVARSDDVGTLALEVREVRCELAPLGIALFDRDCRVLAIRGMRLEVSSLALFKVQRPRRAPIRAGAVTIEDAELVLSPPPAAGSPIAIRLSRIEAGPTRFRSPLSWVFTLRALRAVVTLPLGTVEVTYEAGTLRLAGPAVGDAPIELAVALPVLDPDADAQAELEALVAFGRGVVQRVVDERLQRLLKPRT